MHTRACGTACTLFNCMSLLCWHGAGARPSRPPRHTLSENTLFRRASAPRPSFTQGSYLGRSMQPSGGRARCATGVEHADSGAGPHLVARSTSCSNDVSPVEPKLYTTQALRRSSVRRPHTHLPLSPWPCWMPTCAPARPLTIGGAQAARRTCSAAASASGLVVRYPGHSGGCTPAWTLTESISLSNRATPACLSAHGQAVQPGPGRRGAHLLAQRAVVRGREEVPEVL